ncbi:class I SAM-dependent methyltransferase [Pseudomonas putida]|uniref:Methyltransferase domain-containing protein n=1 Tax=Pseudomonas putida TaxID=303 RepID=A0AAW6Q031_PSEPU|nr:methyltransferase domain-containing protein [Pseudomonas putida]MDF3874047.1 methyltransferase domain-containing protein [Pseudomonas putida]MDF3877265.1 methyltransferase domain-containing protein [Pseudomonas putida]
MTGNPSSAYEARFAHAQKMHGDGYIEEAIAQYSALTAEQPDDLALKVALGSALLQQGKDGLAEPYLREAWEGAPQDMAANFFWGQLLNRRGDHAAAHDCFLTTVAFEPRHASARRALATLALYRGDLDEAYHWVGSLSAYQPKGDVSAVSSQLEMLLNKRRPGSEYYCGYAQVFSRSSKSAEGPPGERDLLKINPERIEGILSLCGWSKIEPGTLNLSLKFNFEDVALAVAPSFYEAGADVVYPEGYRHIPKARVGYWYYTGFVHYQGRHVPVLFRRAVTPNSADVIEVFAENAVREVLGVSDGASVLCYFASPDAPVKDEQWLTSLLEIYSIFFAQAQQFGRKRELYQGHEGWGMPGQRPTLHRFEKYALDRWLDPQARVLDIGCNIGCFGIEVSKSVGSYVGFDINESLVQIARRLAKYHAADNCEFLASSFEDYRQSNPGKFDLIFSFAVHVWIGKPMNGYVADLKEMLEPGGIVVIESNDLVRNDDEFFINMASFYEQGFFLLHKGVLQDDGVINRGFCVFKLLT